MLDFFISLLSFGLKLHIKKKKKKRKQKTGSKTKQNGQGSRYSLANYGGPLDIVNRQIFIIHPQNWSQCYIEWIGDADHSRHMQFL